MHQRSLSQPWITGGLIALSAGNSVVSALTASRGTNLSESTEVLWYFVFSVLVTLWARNDIADRAPAVSREYSHLLMFFFWPVVLPYHLLKSRGVEGLVLFIGFLAIYIAPYVVQVITWVNSTHAS